MSERILVLDATVLINFAATGRLALLGGVGHCVLTPVVQTEVTHPREQAAIAAALEASWIRPVFPTSAELRRSAQLMEYVGPGEAEAAAVAEARGWVMATDDGAARGRFRGLKVRLAYTGTVGILARLVEAGTLTIGEADRALHEMVEEGYRSPVVSIGVLLSDIPTEELD